MFVLRPTSLFLTLLGVLLSPLSLVGQESTCHSKPIARIGEQLIDLSPNGINIGETVSVLSDGRFHLERRLQILPANTASLTIFESTLSREQLQTLQKILLSADIASLHDAVEPAIPMTAPTFYFFEARINYEETAKRVGYLTWEGGTNDTSPNNSSEQTRQIWSDSQTKLMPLLQWFRALHSANLKPVEPSSATACFSEQVDE